MFKKPQYSMLLAISTVPISTAASTKLTLTTTAVEPAVIAYHFFTRIRIASSLCVKGTDKLAFCATFTHAATVDTHLINSGVLDLLLCRE